MAFVSGPTSGLPGRVMAPDAGSSCDTHGDRVAVARVQGETDSFGAEYIDMCQECLNTHNAEKAKLGGAAMMGMCGKDCSSAEVPLFAIRDYDEGATGPVYYRCAACCKQWRDHDREELEEFYREMGDCNDY